MVNKKSALISEVLSLKSVECFSVLRLELTAFLLESGALLVDLLFRGRVRLFHLVRAPCQLRTVLVLRNGILSSVYLGKS